MTGLDGNPFSMLRPLRSSPTSWGKRTCWQPTPKRLSLESQSNKSSSFWRKKKLVELVVPGWAGKGKLPQQVQTQWRFQNLWKSLNKLNLCCWNGFFVSLLSQSWNGLYALLIQLHWSPLNQMCNIFCPPVFYRLAEVCSPYTCSFFFLFHIAIVYSTWTLFAYVEIRWCGMHWVDYCSPVHSPGSEMF